MHIGKNIAGMVRRTADWIVGFLSGRVAAPGFDGRRSFNVALALGAIALVVGGWTIWRTLNSVRAPLTLPNANLTTAVAELEKLRDKDTDGDGLSDYDELFRSKTSPYLVDSDSDGVSDTAELRQGTDPNCPAGKSCSSITGSVVSENEELPTSFLREALRASGIPQSTLDQLSDADIQRIYQETVAQAGTGSNLNVNGGGELDLNTLRNLQPAEIRNLLVSAGLDQATISSVDDATLKQIFEEAINSDTQE